MTDTEHPSPTSISHSSELRQVSRRDKLKCQYGYLGGWHMNIIITSVYQVAWWWSKALSLRGAKPAHHRNKDIAGWKVELSGTGIPVGSAPGGALSHLGEAGRPWGNLDGKGLGMQTTEGAKRTQGSGVNYTNSSFTPGQEHHDRGCTVILG